MALTKRLAEVRAVLAAATLISLQEAVFRVKMQKVEWNLLLSGRIEQRDALFSHEGTKVAMSSYCPIVEVGPLVEKWGRTDLQRPPFDSFDSFSSLSALASKRFHVKTREDRSKCRIPVSTK